MSTTDMNRRMIETAKVIEDRFGYDPKLCGFAAELIEMTAKAMAQCERKLNAQGKTLSRAGEDMIAKEVFAYVSAKWVKKHGVDPIPA